MQAQLEVLEAEALKLTAIERARLAELLITSLDEDSEIECGSAVGWVEERNPAIRVSYGKSWVYQPSLRHYSKGHLAAVIGDQTFRERLLEKAARQDGIKTEVAVHGRPSIGQIVKATAKAYKVSVASITQPQQGIKQANRPRKYAMYIANKSATDLMS